MIFSLGNLLFIVVVLVILIIYRALDRNNRSLEKVKRFSDKIRDSLAAMVEEKTAEMKNLSIELGVNLKTGKEVLKRVREVEEELAKKASGVGEIEKRLEGYDQALSELVGMTARVDENLKRVQSESVFVDKVGKRIADATARLARVEQEADRVQEKLAEQNRQGLETLRQELTREVSAQVQGLTGILAESEKRVKDFGLYLSRLEAGATELEQERLESLAKGFEQLEVEARGKRSGLLKEFASSLSKALGEAEARGDKLKGALGQAIATFQERLGGQQKWLEEMDRLKEEAARRLAQAAEELETEALKRVAKGMEVYAREIELRFQKLEAAGTDIEALEAGLRQAMERSESLEQERLESLAKGFEQLERESGSRQVEALKEFASSLSKALGEAEVRGGQLKQALDEAFAAAQERLGGQQKWLEEMDRLKEEAARRLAQAAEELELGVLKRVEQSMEVYEREAEYRFQKLEAAGTDIEALEAGLRQAMERSAEALRKEFAAHLQGLSEERQAERAKAQAELAQLEEGMRELEGGLSELKAKAYENVSAQLAVLEDEFFKDLRERGSTLEERLGSFQAEVEAQVGELIASHSAEREALERRYSEELKRELERAHGAAAEELGRQEARSAEFQSAVGERVNAAEKRIAGFVEGLPAQLEGIRQEAQALLHRELAALQQSVTGEVQRLKKEMESTTGAIRQEFASQREELVAAAGEESAGLKADFQTIQERIAQLEEDLTARSERALESFRADWESFQAEFVRRTKEAQAEMEGRMREVKARLAETREKAEALQTGLFSRVEEGYRSLSASLADMEKRVKAFTAQTKLFERSDELKAQLEARVDEMKRDVEKLAVDHKQIEDMEARLAAARRATEELGGKLVRLLAERGKVEGMDSDFRKLLNLSKDLDQRLDTVTSSQDALQEIQAKIRELEALEKATEGRFERLEKKKAILESTINGVDKGFQQLTELEKGLEAFKGEVSSLGTALTEIRAQAEILASNKEKADQVVRRVADIDGILTDLEGRMGKLEKAREWLAKTETRFEHVGKQAQEQVKLLESILKAEKKQSRGEDGAPGLDKRDTVIKLAHLGWSPQEIARTTRLSRGEVELILELAPKQ